MFSTPTLITQGSSLCWHRTKSIWLGCCCYFKIIIGLELIFSERLSQKVKTVWKFTWSHWTGCWILDGWYLQRWFVSPQSLGLLTQSLSVETESMGFPIHSSHGISKGSDKGIIMFLIKCSMSQYFVLVFTFVWTGWTTPADCVYSQAIMLEA